MNKVIYVFITLFFTVIFANSQEATQPKYLLSGNGKVVVSGFGGPTVGFSAIEDNLAVFTGGGGAVLLNQKVFFGGYGEGLSTIHERDPFTIVNASGFKEEYTDLRTEFGHGGFWLGYIHQSHKAIHLAASTKVGWGGASLIDKSDWKKHDGDLVTDNVFVLTPQLEVELNMLRWFKINIGAGYRLVSGFGKTYENIDGERVKYFDEADFSQPELTVSFLFGGFGKY